MKKTIYIFSTLLAVIGFDSCTNDFESPSNENGTLTISANIGGELETRTYLSGVNTLWKTGDQISVNGNPLTLKSGEGTASATFTANFSGKGSNNNQFLAAYPAANTVYTPGTSGAIGTLTVAIPENQTNVSSEQLSGVMPMAAFGKSDANDNLSLNFKNAANILNIRLWNSSGKSINRIEVASSEAYLSGTFTVTPDVANGTVEFSNWTGASKNLTITCPTPISLGTSSATATDFFLLIPKISCDTELTLKIYDTDGLYQKNTITVSDSRNNLLKTNASNKICKTNVKEFTPTGVAGALSGKFSVSTTKKVNFSWGNLQWSATGGTSTPTKHEVAGGGTASGTWRFADNQWDFVGGTTNGNVYANGVKCNNASVAADYTGWIDLFGWGTSGYHQSSDSYNHNYYPYSTEKRTSQYSTTNYYGFGPSTGTTPEGPAGLTKTVGNISNSYYDWGLYNAISNGGNTPGLWRILSSDEWNYLLNNRSVSTIGGTSNVRFAEVKVNGIRGAMMFPDEFTWPSSLSSVVPSTFNTFSSNWNDINYTTEQFAVLEQAGVMFIPTAGNRDETVIKNDNTDNDASSVIAEKANGSYWSGTKVDKQSSYRVRFNNEAFETNTTSNYRYLGYSVRLVRDCTQANAVAADELTLETW